MQTTQRKAIRPLLLLALGLTVLDSPALRADASDPFLAQTRVHPVIALKARPFPLEAVRLLGGPFKHAQELDHRYLLSLSVDRLLRNFRVNAGLSTHAKPLGGWEAPTCELRGHFVGHYLSACAMMYASTGDPQLKAKGDAIVAGLAACQAKLGTGYLSAFPESYIERVIRGQPVWAPWYTIHKILAGLQDMYVYCHNKQALEVAQRLADWIKRRTDSLSQAQMQFMLRTEQGGMNETLANLYALTGDASDLRLAQRFNHLAVLVPASEREDKLTGLHANTQIPKFIGAARQYELTGQRWLHTAATFFWNTVVKERSYVIGGNSDYEHFTPKDKLSQALSANTCETCNTYNMLKLTRHLFEWDPRAEYADYYERALYNHILASQNPVTGMMCYYVPLKSGSHKVYNTPLNSFWCCTGTGVENHSKYGDSIYFNDGANGLYVNLFIASKLDWTAQGVHLRQETRFPEEGATRLVFQCRRPTRLKVHLRHPYWATADFTVAVNGKIRKQSSAPSSYVVLDRVWRSGDVIRITMPFTLRTQAFTDNPRRFAYLNGPLVLAAVINPKQTIPAIVSTGPDVTLGFEPVADHPGFFHSTLPFFRRLGQTKPVSVTLEPFYKIYGDQHYVVYWDRYTPTQWQSRQTAFAAEQARQAALEARTVDFVQPGEASSEHHHHLQSEHSGAGEFNNRSWRDATNGGWFSYQLKVLPGVAQSLRVSYWGSDVGNRVFDVLLDGNKVATVRLENNRPGHFYDQTYPLPADLVQGKSTVTVRFQAHSGATAGGVFGCRVVKQASP